MATAATLSPFLMYIAFGAVTCVNPLVSLESFKALTYRCVVKIFSVIIFWALYDDVM